MRSPVEPVFASMEFAFPTLTPAQIARIAVHGITHTVNRGDVLIEAGVIISRFFVVVSGEIEVFRIQKGIETVVTVHSPGKFTGEANMLSGRQSLVTARVTESGEVIELDRAHLLQIVQTDAELGEILLRAFIFRRLALIDHNFGDLVLVGSSYSPGTLRVREFLTRNSHPYTNLDLDRDTEAQAILDRFNVTVSDVPVLIRGDKEMLRNPSNREIATKLGFNDAVDRK
ncbi:MAG TPA: cyclic nucleotide-binding domain-containing protein, partial [Gemmatimonadaceae bacterium]|nr:cyclic nucleotide-binding domain-containing protein [Gemmatimonadaceae bacterium]